MAAHLVPVHYVHAGKPTQMQPRCLGTTLYSAEKTVPLVENYFCELYQPKLSISVFKDLRLWYMFKKDSLQETQSDRPLRSQTARYEVTIHALYQMIVRNNDRVCSPRLPQPDRYGRN